VRRNLITHTILNEKVTTNVLLPLKVTPFLTPDREYFHWLGKEFVG